MKKAIRKYLLKKGLYYPLKYSRLFHLYRLLFKPHEIKQEQKEVQFYRSFLPACKLIFDVGANDGHKTKAFLHIAEKIVSCEPDTENFKLLQARFSKKKSKIYLENVALSGKAGKVMMNIHHPGSAFNTLSPKWRKVLESDNMNRWDEKIIFSGKQEVVTTTLDMLINRYGLPDFVKIDVEGFEEEVLIGLSRRISFLSFETLLPDYAEELRRCISIILSLDPDSLFNIALHEKLIWPDFVSSERFNEWITANGQAPSFEVIVKMKV